MRPRLSLVTFACIHPSITVKQPATQRPDMSLIADHAYGSTHIMCASVPVVPEAANTANAREWPITPISRGAHQQPTKKPTKCADPNMPICSVENPR